MNGTGEPRSERSSRRFTPGEASRLLLVGLARKRRPIDAVIERLAAPDGDRWFEAAIAGIAGAAGADARGFAALDVETLTAAKDGAKAAMAGSETAEAAAAATVTYFAAVAAAIERHGATITARPTEDFAEPFLELAAVAPEPWAEVFAAALRRLESMP